LILEEYVTRAEFIHVCKRKKQAEHVQKTYCNAGFSQF